MCSIISHLVLYVVILSFNYIHSAKWNKECESHNYCYKLLDSGAKYTWSQASDLCKKENGYLLTDSWFTVAENVQLIQTLVNDSDTWTSLQLVNGYIQEVANYTSYSSRSEELWDELPVWGNDTCVKLTKGRKLRATNCSTRLSVVCTGDWEEIRKPVLDCDVDMKPVLTVGGLLGRHISHQKKNIEVKEEEKDEIVLLCEVVNENVRIDWIKDGIYLKRRESRIQPAITLDPSKRISRGNNKGYSIQGDYWCEVWIPGCSKKFSSDKIKLIFKNVITAHFILRKSAGNIDLDDVVKKVQTSLQPCGTQSIKYPDIRRGYTSVNSTMVATLNILVYIIKNETNCDADHALSEAQKQLSTLDVVKYGVSFQSLCKRKEKFWKRSVSNCTANECQPCPPQYTLYAPYCVHITEPEEWHIAYKKCFQTGIEKTPLDHKEFWMNETLIESFECFLQNDEIWLAAQRKFDYGPLYYSGPVKSDFNYTFNEMNTYNLSWAEDDIAENNIGACLALNVTGRRLRVLSCERKIPFVCIFPSEFWKDSVTYDVFRKCKSDCAKPSSLTFTWKEASENCEKGKGILIADKSEYYLDLRENNQHIELEDEKYIGSKNSGKSLVNNLTSWTKFEEWIGLSLLPTDKVYQTYKGEFLFNGTNQDSKHFACIVNATRKDPMCLLTNNDDDKYVFELDNTTEANYLYGIKCYLNGRIVNISSLDSHRHGYLFCEVLTHLPTMLLRSKGPMPENLNVGTGYLSFACQIVDQNQPYNFSLHDLSFQSNVVGSVFYYEKKLSKKLNSYNVTVDKVTRQKKGINIYFHIGHSSDESSLKTHYTIISGLLPIGKEVTLENRIVEVVYLRNTKYCMEEEVPIDINMSNCTGKATWPRASIGDTTLTTERCVKCNNFILSRECKGNFSTGAEWESDDYLLDDYLLSDMDTPVCKEKDTLEEAKELISNTVISVSNYNTLEHTGNLTNNFIHSFESLLKNKPVNGSFNGDTETVYIYSSLIRNGFLSFGYNGHSNKPEIKPIGTDERLEGLAIAVHLTHNNSVEDVTNQTILISVFENSTIFPYITSKFLRISPVLLISVPENLSVNFPVKILFEYTNNTKKNVLCAFWNETTEEWDTTNSKYVGKNVDELHQCFFSHLSSFTLILLIEGDPILDVISLIGCYSSLVGLALVLLTFVLFPKYRSYQDSKLIACLSLSLFVTYLIFVAGFTQTSNKIVCITIAAFLHYFMLASFCWMLVEAFHNYMKFVKVIGIYIPGFMYKASGFAWGLPLVPVIIIVSYDYDLYIHQEYCWIDEKVINFALIIPTGIICGMNLIFFFIVIITVHRARASVISYKKAEVRSMIMGQMKLSICMFMLLGLSWIFGYIALFGGGIVFNYIFCITTTPQGFIIFIFFIVREKRAREAWSIIQRYKQSRDLQSGGKTQTTTFSASF